MVHLTSAEMTLLIVSFRWVLGLTLLMAGVAKLRHLSAFVAGVLDYDLLPAPLGQLYGRLLPLIEIGTGVFLLLNRWVRPSAFISGLMFISFAIAVIVNLVRKRDIPCYCFGADSSTKLGWHTLLRIMLLFMITVPLAIMPSTLDPISAIISNPSLSLFINSVPLLILTAFGLSVLSLTELAPYIVRAWTEQPGITTPAHSPKLVWTREASEEVSP
jgi:uncharacterized membrane protein YphA (DoxX/SURF4 family)